MVVNMEPDNKGAMLESQIKQMGFLKKKYFLIVNFLKKKEIVLNLQQNKYAQKMIIIITPAILL